MMNVSLEPTAVNPVGGAQPATEQAPATAGKRMAGIDAARGTALLGMIAVHALYYTDAAGRPTWSAVIFSGRAAAAFAVLSGIGIAFMTGRRRVPFSASRPAAATLVTRALAIGAIGLALGYTDAVFGTVILPYYAVMFLLAIPLVFLSTRAVAVTGVVIAAVVPALSHVLLPVLPAPSLQNPSFVDFLSHPVRLLSELSLTGVYPALPWMSYLCAGLVVGRLNLTKPRVAVALLGIGTALAVAAWGASAALLRYGGMEHIWAAQPNSGLTYDRTSEVLLLGGNGTAPTSTWWWLVVDTPHTATPLDLLGTTGTALALLGAMLLLDHITRPALRRLIAIVRSPLSAAGSMTLTLYTAHIAFLNSDYDTYDATTGYIVQVVGVLLIGLAWRAMVGRGPLEALLLVLTTRARRWAAATAHRPTPAGPPWTAGNPLIAGADTVTGDPARPAGRSRP